jgi:beta-phosphoglucomutase-like phosphatase (HAD superfamily)
MRDYNSQKLIQMFISRDDVFKIKPHPEGFLNAAKSLGVKPDEVLLVGEFSK